MFRLPFRRKISAAQSLRRGRWFRPQLESLETRITPYTGVWKGRIVEDLTGNGLTADDPGVPGWSCTVQYGVRDLFTGADGQPSARFLILRTATATTDGAGIFTITVNLPELKDIEDPTPDQGGLDYNIGEGLHELDQTPGWRMYTNDVSNSLAYRKKHQLYAPLTTASLWDLDPFYQSPATTRVYRETRLTGSFFSDWDGDATRDAAEPGISGVIVDQGWETGVYSNTGDDTVTGPDGKFTNVNWEPGVYDFYSKDWFERSGYNTFYTTVLDPIHITSGMVNPEFNFGEFKKPALRGQTFWDYNGNGLKDKDDTPFFNGVQLTGGGKTFKATQDLLTGKYEFKDLEPGIYHLTLDEESRKQDYFLVKPLNEVTGNGNRTEFVFQALSEEAFTFDGDFGVFPGTSIIGRKFEDVNHNGVFDHGTDQVIAGATMELYLNNPPPEAHRKPDQTVKTNDKGFFVFSPVGPGMHRVRQVLTSAEKPALPRTGDSLTVTVNSFLKPVTDVFFGVITGKDLAVTKATRADDKKVDVEYASYGGTGPFTIGLYRSADTTFGAGDQPVGLKSITPPDGGGSFTTSFAFTTPYVHDRNHPYLLAVVDPDRKVTEVQEGNNTRVIERLIDPKPLEVHGTFTYNAVEDRLESKNGTVTIGFKPLTGEAFVPLLTTTGTVGYDEKTIQILGQVSGQGPSAVPLFTGYCAIDTASQRVRTLRATGPTLLKLAGMEMNYSKISFVNPDGTTATDSYLDVQGVLKAPAVFGGFEVKLEDPNFVHISPQGLDVSAQVTFPKDMEVKLTDWLALRAKDASATYLSHTDLHPDGALRVKGVFTAVVDKVKVALDLSGDESFIEFGKGGYDIVGKATVSDFELGNFKIVSAALFRDSVKDIWRFDGEIGFKPLLGDRTVIGGIGIRQGKFDYLAFGMDNLNWALPWPPTGFVQKLFASGENLARIDPAQSTDITFTGGLTLGEQFSFPAVPQIGLNEPVDNVALVRVDLSVKAGLQPTESAFTFVKLGGGVEVKILHENLVYGKLDGEVTFTKFSDPSTYTLKASGALKLFNSLEGSFTLTVDKTGATGLGKVHGKLDLPKIGRSFELPDAQAYFQYRPNDSTKDDFVVLSAPVSLGPLGTKQVGIKINFSERTWETLYGMTEIKAAQDGLPPGDADATEFVVAAGTDQLLATTSWEKEVPDAHVELVRPDGTVLFEAALGAGGGVVTELSSPTSRAVTVGKPTAGTWKVRLVSGGDPGDTEVKAYRDQQDPAVEVRSAVPSGNKVSVRYFAQDADSPDAKVSLFYDTDGQGFDGLPIVQDLPAAGAATASWDTSRVTTGTYYVYAMLHDGRGGFRFDYLDAPVRIDHAPPTAGGVQLRTTDPGISQIVVPFSKDMDPAIAADAAHYRLRGPGPDLKLFTADDVIIPVAPTYDAAKQQVVLQPMHPTVANKPITLVYNKVFSLTLSGLVDQAGQALAGNAPTAGTHHVVFGLGTQLGYTDVDGDAYGLTLTGPGQLYFQAGDPDADGKGAIERIVAVGTQGASSSLVVTVTQGKNGDGVVAMGSVEGAGLQSLNAAAVDLTGSIRLTGKVGALALRDLKPGAQVVTAGNVAQTTSVSLREAADNTSFTFGTTVAALSAARLGHATLRAPALSALTVNGDCRADLTLTGAAPGQPALGTARITGALADAFWSLAGSADAVMATGAVSRFRLKATGSLGALDLGVADDVTVEVSRAISGLRARHWTTGKVTAGSVGALVTTGDAVRGLGGAFGAKLVLTGAGVAAGQNVLGFASIAGTVRDTELRVAGSVGTFTAGRFLNSALFVGFVPTDATNPFGGGTFTAGAKLQSLNVTGVKAGTNFGFANSFVVAPAIGSVTLANVKADNSLLPFGVLVDKSLGGLKVLDPAFTWNAADPPNPGGFGDFRVYRGKGPA